MFLVWIVEKGQQHFLLWRENLAPFQSWILHGLRTVPLDVDTVCWVCDLWNPSSEMSLLGDKVANRILFEPP